ncbi:MAG: heavy-metal-associated domain-containing protein [Bacteroidales bacterium]|jgi:mercuric ion binding protein|nr:heavy-metal-associated domain-containing protein [Bacteroidales bacterium]
MKTKNTFLLIAFFSLLSANTYAQKTTQSFTVQGSCSMCEERIEQTALGVDGVSSAEWNSSEQKLTVSFDESQTNVSAIQKSIAAVGHDTELFTANDEVYANLPGCCQYERKKEAKKQKSSSCNK